VVLGAFGLLAALVGWFVLGNAIGVGVMHDQRCRARGAGDTDPSCGTAVAIAGRARLGACLLLGGSAATAGAVVIGLVRVLRRHRDQAA
jgi:hypothetical protein